MNRRQADYLRANFRWFEPCGPAMVAKVMRNLADTHPGIRAMFPDEMSELNERIFTTLGKIVAKIDQFHLLEAPLAKLGRTCAAEGANPAHYKIFREELLAVMADLAGPDWTDEMASLWRQTFEAVSGAMIAGAVREEFKRAA